MDEAQARANKPMMGKARAWWESRGGASPALKES